MPLLPKHINRLIGRAMHDYGMLADGDRVLVAVSGGVDSLFLAWLLAYWLRKAPIKYDLVAVHLDMGFESGTAPGVTRQLKLLEVPFSIEQTDYGRTAQLAENGKNGCYHCARQRRNHLFDFARTHGYNKIALGHHRDDIIETLFLNMLYSGNLSTMVPRQNLFDGRLALIRPFAYLEKKEITAMAAQLQIEAVPNPCPLAEDSRRQTVRRLLLQMYEENPVIKGNIFAALGNVRMDYLLKQQNPETRKNHEDRN